MHLCDASAVNAYVLYNGGASRRSFIVELADQLMMEQKERRGTAKHWANEGFQQIDQLYKRYPSKKEHQPRNAAPVDHCYVCRKSGLGKNIRSCSKCEKPVCKKHAADLVLCSRCNVFTKEVRRQQSPLCAQGMRQLLLPPAGAMSVRSLYISAALSVTILRAKTIARKEVQTIVLTVSNFIQMYMSICEMTETAISEKTVSSVKNSQYVIFW
uniref:Uncharacterized protein n=1 Tax=Ditylenchus dipsaci TaxID=166011 RepID=A0A915DFX6_9BILA